MDCFNSSGWQCQVCPPPLADSATYSRVVFHWGVEAALTRARWCTLVVGLLLLPVWPPGRSSLLGLIAIGVALGNSIVVWLLRQELGSVQLHTIQRVATALEWSSILAVVGVFHDDPAFPWTGLFVLLVLTSGVRCGRRGVLAATLAAAAVTGTLLGVEAFVLHVLEGSRLVTLLLWATVLLALAGITTSSLLAAADLWHQWHTAQRTHERFALARRQFGLSQREWELLPLLARDDLTYDQIAAILMISPYTVKTHVQRLGQKLGGAHGRRAVVRAARKAGLLPVEWGTASDPHASDLNSPSPGTEIPPCRG
uniref:Response regulator transcription factor n=2 Tax=Thermorudis TaxID=1649508 RepID=A0A7C2W758_9BACT